MRFEVGGEGDAGINVAHFSCFRVKFQQYASTACLCVYTHSTRVHVLLQHKWRCELLAKNAEIEQYREELDSLMAALRVLQQQGTSTHHGVLGLK